ncbi:MAG: thiamine-phosphate kinase [Vulcanimicrobiaceae bacterium]
MKALREEDLVAAIESIVASNADTRLVVGIGDDAAVWQPSRSHRSVITSDACVEGVHFARTTMTLEDAGWRAMAANASDLAAMGARPVLATISLGVSPESTQEDILALYRGLEACARESCIAIAGGDLVRTPVLTIAITAVGEVRASNLKLRSGGRAGDVLAVTGDLGASAAGLQIALGSASLPPQLAGEALRAHRHPQPRIREGAWLAASRNVHAMMDCSDGLSTDLHRLCAASRLGAALEAVPVATAARALAELQGEDPVDAALRGGEDFELLVAIAPRAFGHVATRFAARFGRALHRIGALRKANGLVVLKGAEQTPLVRSGWDHFEA